MTVLDLRGLLFVAVLTNAGATAAQDLPDVIHRLQDCKQLDEDSKRSILEGIYRQQCNNRFVATKTQWRMAKSGLCREFTQSLRAPFASKGGSVDSVALMTLAERTPGVRKTSGRYESASTATAAYYQTSLGAGARWAVVRTVGQELNYYEDMNRIVRSRPTAMKLEGLVDLFAPFPGEHHRLMRMAKLPWWELERGEGRWRVMFGRT